jgi:hypothetical protein
VAVAVYAVFFAGWQFAVPVVGGAAVPALLVAVATQRGWRPGLAAGLLVRANRTVATAPTEALPGAGASSPEGRASSPNAARLHTPAGRVAFGVPLVVGIAVASTQSAHLFNL